MGKLQTMFVASILFAIFTLGLGQFTGEVTTTYNVLTYSNGTAYNVSFVDHAQDVATNVAGAVATVNTGVEDSGVKDGSSDTGNVLNDLWGLLLRVFSLGNFILTPLGDFLGLVGIPPIFVQLINGLVLGAVAWGVLNAIKGGIEA